MKIFNLINMIDQIKGNKNLMDKIRTYNKYPYIYPYTDEYFKNEKHAIESNKSKETVAFEIAQNIIDMFNGISHRLYITDLSEKLLSIMLAPTTKYTWSRKYKNFQIVWTGNKYMVLNLKYHTSLTVDSLFDDEVRRWLYPYSNPCNVEAAVNNIKTTITQLNVRYYRAIRCYRMLANLLHYPPIFIFSDMNDLLEMLFTDGEEE